MIDHAYTYRRVATSGCEILTPTGKVIGWSVDEHWAVMIVAALNLHNPPLSGDGALLEDTDFIQDFYDQR